MLRATTRLRASLSPNPPANAYQVFDRHAKLLQKNMAASKQDGSKSRTVDYLREEVADRLMERFWDIKRNFDTVLDFGSGPGHFSKLLEPSKTRQTIMYDSCEKTLNREKNEAFQVQVKRIHADEERLLEVVGEQTHDAIVSCMSLHWINDLPGVLTQVQRALKPDGLFLGCMLGGDTLFELRTSLQLAQVEREGGISPHVSPMTDTRDVSNLLGRAGFTLLTVDIEDVRVSYPSMWELMEDLRDMGESNAIMGRRPFLRRDTLAAASAIYKAMHGEEDGSVPATFQIIYMIGWKPSEGQRKPLERGSGQVNLKDVLERG